MEDTEFQCYTLTDELKTIFESVCKAFNAVFVESDGVRWTPKTGHPK